MRGDATNRATETSKHRFAGADVKRGNLHPEQHQIGRRVGGNVGGMELPASVAPFILRGVSLVGINSVDVAMARRRAIWERLAHSVDRQHLATLTTHVPLAGAIAAAEAIVAGTVRGRIVVDVA